MSEVRTVFVGAGDVASWHCAALDALRHYYPDAPRVTVVAVASATAESRERFARRHGIPTALSPDEVWGLPDIDAVYLLGPNEVHCSQLGRALGMPSVTHVYVEKPVCVSVAEEEAVRRFAGGLRPGQHVQAGYSFLQMAAVRTALNVAREIDFGVPVHFHARFLHSGYLDRGYRDKRQTRLKPAPVGGVTVDLGSHLYSLLVAFLGPNTLEVLSACQSGVFPDVPAESDLCMTALLRHAPSGAVGTVQASRISAGAGDLLEIELRFARGAVRISAERPDVLEVYLPKQRGWQTIHCGNDYSPTSRFPAPHVAAGWLRALIHTHYVFLTGQDPGAFVPDLPHALEVQRLIHGTVARLGETRTRRPTSAERADAM